MSILCTQSFCKATCFEGDRRLLTSTRWSARRPCLSKQPWVFFFSHDWNDLLTWYKTENMLNLSLKESWTRRGRRGLLHSNTDDFVGTWGPREGSVFGHWPRRFETFSCGGNLEEELGGLACLGEVKKGSHSTRVLPIHSLGRVTSRGWGKDQSLPSDWCWHVWSRS